MASDILNTVRGDLASEPQRSRSYALWIKIGLVSVLMAILFGATLIDMAHDWWNEPAWSQGMLLPPLAFYIAWLNRDRTFSYVPNSDSRGLLCIAVACGSFLLGKLASEFFMMRFAFVILLIGLVWTFWGFRRFRTLVFPFLLLATMVPLPVMVYNSLAAPLQLLASDLATRIAQGFGVSVFRDGNIIQLAGVSLGVAEACSGLNSLSALIVGSLLLGYLLCSRTATRVVLFAIAIPLAIVINILRVAGTALLADYNQEFALGFYHAFSGWLVFVAGFGVLYLCARLLHTLLERERAI
jgi:exosortase